MLHIKYACSHSNNYFVKIIITEACQRKVLHVKKNIISYDFYIQFCGKICLTNENIYGKEIIIFSTFREYSIEKTVCERMKDKVICQMKKKKTCRKSENE